MPVPIQIHDSQVRSILAAADATGGEVVFPAGDLLIARPVKITRSAIVRGMGIGVTRLVPPAGWSMPAVVAVHPHYDTCPVSGGVLRPAPDGGFLDLGMRVPATPSRFLFDIAFTLDTLPPADTEYVLASSRSSFDNITYDIPFELTVVGAVLKLRIGGATVWQGACLAAGRQRVAFRHGDDLGSVYLWRVDASGPALLYTDESAGRNVWPDHCPLMIGTPPVRWPESTAIMPPCPGLVVHQVAYASAAAWSPSDPPTGPDVINGYVQRIDFASAEIDGCLIRGSQGGLPLWLLWRAGAGGDEQGFTPHLRDFEVAGNGLGLAGVWVAGAHDWSAERLSLQACRYGLAATGQSYQSAISGVTAGGCGVGLALLNNSGLMVLTNPHLGPGNLYGLVVSESAGVVVTGGWVINNSKCNVLVKGYLAAISATGLAAGFEGDAAPKNVFLSNVHHATFTGCGFQTHATPMPQIECVGCGRVVFVAPQFGPHPDCPGSVLVTDHDPNHQVEVVGATAIWPAVPGQLPPPIMHPESTYRTA